MPSPIETGLCRPWYRLRLPEPLEATFHGQAQPPSGRYLQSWLLIFIVLNILSVKVDLDLFGAEAFAVPAWLTLGVFIPLALAFIVALRGRPSPFRQSAAVMATGLTDMAIVLNSARIVPPEHTDTYLILAAIVPLVAGLIAPMSFRHCLWFCGASFALYVLFVLGFEVGGADKSGILTLVASLILVPLKLSYSREWETKRSFLLGLLEQRQAEALAQANARLTILSETDPLTGVANRRLFAERLEQGWVQACSDRAWLGLVLIDIDRFKRLNDTAGHAEGDRCLVQVADALRAPVEARGGLIARYGGEEFVALLPDTAPEAVIAVGEQLRAAVAGLALPHPGLATGAWVSVSVGVTASHGATRAAGVGSADLLRAADEALYAAKRRGRDRVEAAVALPQRVRASERAARTALTA